MYKAMGLISSTEKKSGMDEKYRKKIKEFKKNQMVKITINTVMTIILNC
jgi:hypothetical protein